MWFHRGVSSVDYPKSKFRGFDPAAALAAKAAAQEMHFIVRAKQRFGLRVSPERYLKFCRQVIDQRDGVIYLGATPPDRTAWLIRLGGYLMRVIYDESTARLVTCIPFREPRPNLGANDWVQKQRRLAGKKKFRRLRETD